VPGSVELEREFGTSQSCKFEDLSGSSAQAQAIQKHIVQKGLRAVKKLVVQRLYAKMLIGTRDVDFALCDMWREANCTFLVFSGV